MLTVAAGKDWFPEIIARVKLPTGSGGRLHKAVWLLKNVSSLIMPDLPALQPIPDSRPVPTMVIVLAEFSAIKLGAMLVMRDAIDDSETRSNA